MTPTQAGNQTSAPEKRLLKVLKGEAVDRPPVWFMRQAGRYLPEYRETRAKAGSFLNLCYDPELATEVTHQPLRRYDFDAAILFADILLVPHALGQHLEFVEGEGPKLDPIETAEQLAALKPDRIHDHLDPVYETVRRLASTLPPHVTLIGFAGAPWTVASYMVGGKGSIGLDGVRRWIYGNRGLFDSLMDMLVDVTAAYLSAQVKAGAQVLQVFDSWAGGLPPEGFEDWCVRPMHKLVTRLKETHPDVPIIGFPRASGALYEHFVKAVPVDGVSLDTGVPLDYARDVLKPHTVVQGNLDPMVLVAGGEALDTHVRARLDALGPDRYIFNLGHGIVPQTPPEHVARVLSVLQAWAADRTPKASQKASPAPSLS
ncbi:MAG: uroporphyrinogen decarboxylase [Alphaproteobacteria bacterium]